MYQMLAVDDTKAERDCVAFLVNEYRLPVRLEMAKDGQEAAEMLERKRYDILFTDIRMPRRDGLELSRHALSLNPEMKVILFSGYHDFTYAKQAIGMGVTDYLLKPINTEEFRGVLQKTLEDIQRQERRLRQFRKHILQLLLNAADASDLRAQYGDALDFLDAASAVCLLEMNDANLNSLPVDLEEYLCGILPEGFIYLDTNQTQSLLLVLGEQAFDGGGVALKIVESIRRDLRQTCYLAYTEKAEWQNIGEVYRALDERLQTRFLSPETLIFPHGSMAQDAVSDPEHGTHVDTTPERRIKLVQAHIAAHFNRDLSLENLARLIYIHPDYLCRVFKQVTGMTIIQYIKTLRMSEALRLLRTTHMKVVDVGRSVGYENPSYFIQIFRECTGLSPDKYRQQHARP